MAKVANKDPLDGYRYERKFLISQLTSSEIESLIRLHPAMFSEIYTLRFVNSLYFDSFDMMNYFDNVEGLHDRVKIRVRWYGDLFGHIENPVLEIKIKKGLMGRKVPYPLSPFSINKGFSSDTIRQVFKSSQIPQHLKSDLMSLQCVLLGRYNRKYYQSVCHNYRITIDKDMEFYKPSVSNSDFIHKSADWVNTVMELKYKHDKDDDAERIINHFPFRMTKNSKYVSGIESLNL